MVRKTNRTSALRSISKKFFAFSIATYFSLLFLNQIFLGQVEERISLNLLLGLALASIVIMLFFTQHPTAPKRATQHDWGLIIALACIGAALNFFEIADWGIWGIIPSVLLIWLTVGLALYVWSGNDEHITFALFGRDHRLKFSTYIQRSLGHWLSAFLLLALVLVANFLLYTPTQAPDPTPDATITPSPTPENEKITPSPTPAPDEPTPTPEPTVTPTPEPIPDTYTLHILNGSGRAGAAGEVNQVVVDAGFTVATTGNADTYTYTETIIRYKESYASLAKELQTVLADLYPNATLEALPVDDASAYDVAIIQGE